MNFSFGSCWSPAARATMRWMSRSARRRVQIGRTFVPILDTLVPDARGSPQTDGTDGHDRRRREERLDRCRQGPDAGQGIDLADPPRVRLGQRRVATLDAVLRRALSLRPLRRAWLWHEPVGGRGPRPGTLARGPHGGDR